MMQASKDGFFYVLDRTNGQAALGEEVRARELGEARRSHDGTPGREQGESVHRQEGKVVFRRTSARTTGSRCPSVRSRGSCTSRPRRRPGFTVTRRNTSIIRWRGISRRAPRPSGRPAPTTCPSTGYLLAWNPITNTAAWRVDHATAWNGGVLSTAGNLVVARRGGRQVRHLSRSNRHEVVGDADSDRRGSGTHQLFGRRRAVHRGRGRLVRFDGDHRLVQVPSDPRHADADIGCSSSAALRHCRRRRRAPCQRFPTVEGHACR